MSENDPAPDASRQELTLTRVFSAPRELVWRCWTEPEHLARFFGPRGTHVPLDSITLELRPGGAFHLTMVSDTDGTAYPSTMTVAEVVPPERLVYGWPAQRGLGAGTVTITLTDLGDGRTELVNHFAGDAPPQILTGMRHGTASALDQLGALLEELQAHPS